MSDNTDKRTATQKIEDLEKVVSMLYNATMQNKNVLENLLRMQGEAAMVKDALTLLNKKVEAIVQVSDPLTGISAKSVSDKVVAMNVLELKGVVDNFVKSGQLVAADTIAANGFVVCEETAADGTVVNPRIQFRMDTLEAATSEALLGKKVGDSVSFGTDKFGAKILEVYTIAEPKAAEAAPAPAATDATPTTAATDAVTADSAPEATTPLADTAPAAAVTPPAPTGPSNDALANPPAETPVVQFVSDAGSTTTTAS